MTDPRPAPRPPSGCLLVSVLSLVIMSLICGTVSAETINIDIDDAYADSNVYELIGDIDTLTGEEFPKFLVVRNAEELQAPFTLVISGKIKTTRDDIYEGSTPIELGSTPSGHGTMGYQKYSDG